MTSRRRAWVVAAVLLGAISGSVFAEVTKKLPRFKPEKEASEDGAKADPADDFFVLDRTKLERVVRAFMDAEDLATLKKMVREAKRVAPLMDVYYSSVDGGYAPSGFRSLDKTKVETSLGMAICQVYDKRSEGGILVVAPAADGRYVVDWESWVGYGEMRWADAVKTPPATPKMFRVRLRADDYFNYGFDEKTYLCFRMDDSKGTATLYGYVKRGSDLASKLAPGSELPAVDDGGVRWFKDKLPSREQRFVMLKLQAPRIKAAPNQVEISEFLQEGWIVQTR